ncbi:MAG: hypothetical protein AAFP90_06395 [Planctomycetota bacterium]
MTVEPTRGILTAAKSPYWHLLRTQINSVCGEGFSIAVVDHGLTDFQRQEIARRGGQVVDVPDPVLWDHSIADNREGQTIVPYRSWLKPWVCQHSPFDQTVWVDADAITIRNVGRLFDLVADGDFLTLESWTSDQYTLMMYNDLLQRLADTHDLPSRHANASLINAGVLGFSGRPMWIDQWWELSVKLLSDPSLRKLCETCDQCALVATLCTMDMAVPTPRIMRDRGLNWPANGLPSQTNKRRKQYPWGQPDILNRLRDDHPDATVVHWLGTEKPWFEDAASKSNQ